MEKDQTYYENLIHAYFAGELSAESQNELLAWIHNSPENKELFEQYKKVWSAIAQHQFSQLDTEQSFEKVRSRIKAQEPISDIRRKPIFSTYLKIAAGIAVLFLLSFLLYLYFSQPQKKTLVAENSLIESKLPDGSHITLNRSSVLEYPSRFDKKQRTVELKKGEAYFDVEHNPEQPFVVKVNEYCIEVLGTKFFVDLSNSNGNPEVLLTSGKIAVYREADKDSKIFLSPGEKLELVPQAKPVAVELESDNTQSWKTRKIRFYYTNLSEVAYTLTTTYGVKVRLSSAALRNCKLTAEFDDQSLESVLNVIAKTLDCSVNKKKDEIIIEGKGCN